MVILGVCVAAVAVEMLSDAGHQPATDAADSGNAWEPWRSYVLRAVAATRCGGRWLGRAIDSGARRAAAAIGSSTHATQRAAGFVVLGAVASAGSAATAGRRRAHAARIDLLNRRAANRVQRANEGAQRRAAAHEEGIRRRDGQGVWVPVGAQASPQPPQPVARGPESAEWLRIGPAARMSATNERSTPSGSIPSPDDAVRVRSASDEADRIGGAPAIARTLRRTPDVGGNGDNGRGPSTGVMVPTRADDDIHGPADPGAGPRRAAMQRWRDGVPVPLRVPWTKRLQAALLLLILSAFLSLALVAFIVAVVLAIASAIAGI